MRENGGDPSLLKNKRGFYVRMRISHKQSRQQEKNLCFTFYKWLLCFLLSLYFLTSYLIGGKPSSPVSEPHLFSSKSSFASRALIESTNSAFLKHPRDFNNEGPFMGLKIFVYELPSKYNKDWLSNERCRNHLFASEVAIHKALLKSNVRTYDPYDADLFFVPVYVSCNFSTVNGFPAIGQARSLLGSAVEIISSSYPFWNRSRGSDHVFVASHDYGACFHAMEHRAIAHGIPDFLKNSILLQTFGVQHKHPCHNVENVVIPPYISPVKVRSTLQESPINRHRDIWVFFRGKMEVSPKNISGRYYSKKVRTAIWKKYNGDRRFYLRRHRFGGYQSEIVRSVFCLCPLGWAPWSPRLVESVALGCIPVIIADGIRLPFAADVRWADISLSVAEKDVGKLASILAHVAETNLTTIQKNLWDPETRGSLLFNNIIEQGDATWHMLHILAGKMDRSYKEKRMTSTQ